MSKRFQSYVQNPVFWGAFLSVILVGAVIYWASWAKIVSYSAPRTNFEVFLASRPNEVGDLLAGVAGALAFIWIIVTVWLQSKELAAQREELKLTRVEMEEQRRATQDMARAMEAQANVLEDERKRRREERASDFLNERLNGIAEILSRRPRIELKSDVVISGKRNHSTFYLANSLPDESSAQQTIRQANQELQSVLGTVRTNKSNGVLYENLEFDDDRIGSLEGLLEAVLMEMDELSDADKQRVRNYRVQRLYDGICELFQLEPVNP